MKLARSTITLYRLPYPSPVRWKDTVEEGGLFALLRLVADDGSVGVAEAPIKPTWAGTSPRALAAALDDMLLPALQGTDIDDPAAVGRRLASFPENTLAKGLIDNACWDLRAIASGQPLWRLLGGEPDVQLSWTVTRASPAAMASEAASMVERFGFGTLKIKGGQDFATDARALAEIRAAVGDRVRLYVDANAAFSVEQGREYARMIANAGATHAEDPCELAPDAWFEQTQRESPIPWVVDSRCQSVRDARLFLERGAKALGIKPTRVGPSIALEIARLAEHAGARSNVGLHAESALGSLAATHVAAALPRHSDTLPAETSFFLAYADQILHETPRIAAGRIRLDDTPGLAHRIDEAKLARHRV
jgi:L-alanine-DL-glutamate epimerase-like enolase superfamily enzyme